MKRIVVALMLLLTFAAAALADTSGTCGSGITYTLTDDGTLTLSGSGTMSSPSPSWDKSLIRTAVVGEGITSLCSDAFYNCINLTAVSLPESLTTLGSWAFQNCKMLESIALPSGLTSLGGPAFYYCRSLREIGIPEGVTEIPEYCFYNCESLRAVELPSGLTTLGNSAFYYCQSLKEIEIPEGVTAIPESCFSGCSSLQTAELPSGLTSLGRSAFSGCDALKEIEIPEGVTEIPESCFKSCRALSVIRLPDSVESIGKSAFKHVRALPEKWPSGLRFIGEGAFDGVIREGMAEIPEGVETLDAGAFGYKLKGLYVPNSVTTMREQGADTIIYCHSGSYAERWAAAYGNPCVILENASFAADGLVVFNDYDTEYLSIGKTYPPVGTWYPKLPGLTPKWTSSDPKVLEVRSDGTLVPKSKGHVTVKLTVGGKSATQHYWIKGKYVESASLPEEIYVTLNETIPIPLTLEPRDAEFRIWSTHSYYDDEGQIAIGYDNTTLTGVKVGDCRRGFMDADGAYARTLIHVTPRVTAIELELSKDRMPANESARLTANVTMLDQHCVNALVTFESSDPAVATVDQTGLVTGVGEGTATLTATAKSGVTASIQIEIEPELTVLRLPGSLKVVEANAFTDTAAQAVDVPRFCERIKAGAFSGCPNLQKVYLTRRAKVVIEEGAFPEGVAFEYR